jgi:hypothetical protein
MSNRKTDLIRHNTSKKHKINVINIQLNLNDNNKTMQPNIDQPIDDDIPPDVNEIIVYSCFCGSRYTQRSNLSRHHRVCNIYRSAINKSNIQETNNSSSNKSNNILYEEDDYSIISDNYTNNTTNQLITVNDIHGILNNLLEEKNSELKSILLEQTQKMMENSTFNINNINSGNINNINNINNNFNLNIFLEQHCKDALSISDFINNHLKIDTSSVEYTGKHGYVEGITKIFMDGLNQLDIYKRPIHCTDLKRETFYVKGEEKWEKDDDQSKIREAIDTVMWKNVDQVRHWQLENPACDVVNSPEFEFHLVIMRQSLGGGNSSDRGLVHRNNDKIIKNIAKAVHLNRKIM